MQIEMWSDIVCPWCTIGRHRLDVAFAARPRVRAEVVWRPFQLHPDWPHSGRSWEEFTTEHWGSPRRARPVFAHVEQVAGAGGLRFDFTRVRRVPHTEDAHRLIVRAQLGDDPWSTVRTLADAYFTGRDDIGDRRRLAALVADDEQGERDEVQAFLDGDDLTADVRDSRLTARKLDGRGVPVLVFDGRVTVTGALPVPALLDVNNVYYVEVLPQPGLVVPTPGPTPAAIGADGGAGSVR